MRFAALLALAALASAGELEIHGTVVDATTSQPMHRARVALSFWKDAGFVHRGALTILTGEDGGFRFTAVPDGEFELQAFKAGYFEGDARVPSIRPGSGAGKGVTLRLTPTSELAVTILDDRGSTVGGAQLRIESKPATGIPFGSLGTTDRVGKFVFVVPPGAYRVTAVGPGSATLLRARGLTFGVTSSVESVEVATGKSIQTEIRVRPIPARTVHLTVETPGGAGQFLLLPAVGQPDDYAIQWSLTPFQPGARAVEITGLAPGTYRLVMANYEKTFQIGDGDLKLAITPADRKY